MDVTHNIPILFLSSFFNFMRHRKYNKYQQELGRKVQANNRLENVLGHRPLKGITILYIFMFNPISKRWNDLEIRHEIENGNDRYSVYLNDKRWPKQWSRTGFCNWMFKRIESVVI